MTRIDFYVLPENSDQSPLPTVCRLCEKAVGAGQRVHVHVPDPHQAQDLDKLLWTYKQGSFIGHERVDTVREDPPLASVLIGSDEPRTTHQDVLINLASDVPEFFSRFERVLEIVCGDAPTRTLSRTRFKFYKERGHAPETHKL
ncbi:MAG: DNA polymerase III subunit chi [Nevskiales bacterium]|nr:DNA polymerase III subunit chi [Nevskiales bacterium]